ncbi:MAG: anti-sigma factor antagonist [Phycisphaerales bacterium]|nr:anti-sigma factor antagonist [Phycisphaerales bacterium]
MSSQQEPTIKKTTHVEFTWDGSILIVKPQGPNIGQREAPIMNADIDPYLKSLGKAVKYMVLDLSGVQFMSSMGIGSCINCRNGAAALGAKPILYGANKDLRALLAMMKIEKLFGIAESRDALNKMVGL